MANEKIDTFYKMLGEVEHTWRQIQRDMKLQIEKVTQAMNDYGPRKPRHKGAGMDFFEPREFRPESDDPGKINVPLTLRMGRRMTIDREAETMQHIYMWRDATQSMEYSSLQSGWTKKQAAEIMLLSFAWHLARNEDQIGILGRKGLYRGNRLSDRLVEQLMDVTIVTGDVPSIGRKVPRNSTAILFGDFLTEPLSLAKSLDRMRAMGLKGYVVMILDPQEIDFNFQGHVEFNGLEGEGKLAFKKAESVRGAYQKELQNHIATVRKVAQDKGFNFVLQRTDQPLQNGLIQIYGLSAQTGGRGPAPGAKP